MPDPLYHWSPRSRLSSINRSGLLPGKPNVDEDSEYRQPGVCTSPDAATAWAYSHDIWRFPGTYDLWQFWLKDTDDVEILRHWGDRIIEVRVHNRIMKRRLHWVGERTIKA